MGLVNISWKPNEKELKSFGKSLLVGFGLIGLVLFFYFEVQKVALGLWFLGATAFFFSYFLPKAAMIIYYPWMGISFVMGTVVSTAIVAFIYYMILTPVGLFFKLTGRDPLCRKLDKEASSYWTLVKRSKPYDVKTYEDQF